MTREEAIQILADLTDNPFLHTWEEQYKALHMAIEALSAEAEWIPREHFDVLKKNYDMLAGLLKEAKARAIGAWIPCSERLPDNKTYVLTTIQVSGRQPHARSGFYHDGFFHNDNGDTWKATDREVRAKVLQMSRIRCRMFS